MKYLAFIALLIVAAILLNRKKVKEVVQQIADGSKEKIDQANASAQKAVDKIADKGNAILPIDLSGNTPVSIVNDNINKSGLNSGLQAIKDRDTAYWNQPFIEPILRTQQEPPIRVTQPINTIEPVSIVNPIPIRPMPIPSQVIPSSEGSSGSGTGDVMYGRGTGLKRGYEFQDFEMN